MVVALLMALSWQVPVTVPGQITKVARADSSNLCDLSETLSQLQAGVEYDLVVYVDGALTYQILHIYEHTLFGPVGYFGMVVDGTTPVCPAGSANVGRRVHVVPLGKLFPGILRFEAVVFNNAVSDGVVVSSARVTVQ